MLSSEFFAQNNEFLEKLGPPAAEYEGTVRLFKLIRQSVCYAGCLFAVGICILNMIEPTSGMFLSSVLLYSSCGGRVWSFLVVTFSSLFHAHLIMTVTPLATIWQGHCYLFAFSVAELLHKQE